MYLDDFYLLNSIVVDIITVVVFSMPTVSVVIECLGREVITTLDPGMH